MRMFLEQGFKGLFYFLKDKNYRSFVYLLLRYGGSKRFTTTNINVGGFKMKVPDTLSFIWQFYEIFYKRSYQFSPKSSSPLIFDCGANVGTSCLYFSREYKNAIIHAFEPDPHVFKALKQNIELNNVKNVELHNAAVWKEDTTLEFDSSGADAGALSQGHSKTSIKVNAIRLKDLIEKEEAIDLLKMDIEGAEVEVIMDCKDVLKRINNIFIEYHSYHDSPQQIDKIISILAENGFRYYLENEAMRKIPFVNQRGKYDMDMQVNIFGYK